MKISLNLPERIGAVVLLGNCQVGSRDFLSLVRAAKKVIKIGPDEVKEYGIVPRQDGRGGLNWDEAKEGIAKEFDLSMGVINYMEETLKTFDKTGQMHMDLLPLADKILGEQKKKRSGKRAA